MLTSFADRETERMCQPHPVRRFPAELHRVMLRKLVQLDAVTALDELRVPPGQSPREAEKGSCQAVQHSRE